MRKLIRTKNLIQRIETQIEKNQRRIQDLAKDNYELRKTLDQLRALPKGTTLTKNGVIEHDKTKRLGKFYDAAYHEQQREEQRLIAEATKKTPETAELVTDSADQEIGMSVEGAL